MNGAWPASTACDLVIADLSDAEAALVERVASVETDAALFRELLLCAFDALRDMTVQHEAQRAAHARLRDEYRLLREQVLLAVEVTDEGPA